MQFSKMHALGNDFMVVDATVKNFYFSPKLIQRLSDRNHGIGFDQLLVVESPRNPTLDFHYRIFNANGSEAFQCGNGARCLARFLKLKGLTNKIKIHVSTKYGCMVLDMTNQNQVCVNMGEPNFDPKAVPFLACKTQKIYNIHVAKHNILCGIASIGNPHCVLQVDKFNDSNIALLGPALEGHERFPERVNVSFMKIINRENIKLRVYERGAGETKSCGSGACASVAVGIQQKLLSEKVRVALPGGNLYIRWKGVGNPLFMTGPATHVYDGFIDI